MTPDERGQYLVRNMKGCHHGRTWAEYCRDCEIVGLRDKLNRYERESENIRQRLMAMGECTGVNAPDVRADVRACTCHPNDNPPTPCQRRYALSECRAAAAPQPARAPMTDEEVLIVLRSLAPDVTANLRGYTAIVRAVERHHGIRSEELAALLGCAPTSYSSARSAVGRYSGESRLIGRRMQHE